MLTEARLQNFRSYIDSSFEFGDGVNIIVGPNASGKTNLLEAVLVLARGSSYRAKDSELVRLGADWARVDGVTRRGTRVVKIEQQHSGAKKTFEIDEQPFLRLSLQKMIPVVLFEPNHLLLLTGSPDLRRSFLDDLIEQTLPGYATARRAYRRVLAQRNALLKKGHTHAVSQIFVWNLRLSELGGKIAQERQHVIEAINERATTTYKGLSHAEADVSVQYQSASPAEQYETHLLRRLESNLERDCLLGFTTHGPHRDDMTILLNDQPADITASRGETRSLILMLKIIELQLLERARSITPLLLLDDVFSELDGKRRHALTSHLKNYQTFITTTDADIVAKNFTADSNIIALT